MNCCSDGCSQISLLFVQSDSCRNIICSGERMRPPHVICVLIDHIYRIILINLTVLESMRDLHRLRWLAASRSQWEYWTRKYTANAARSHATASEPRHRPVITAVFHLFFSFHFDWVQSDPTDCTLFVLHLLTDTQWPSETQNEAAENSEFLADKKNRSNQTEIM